MSKYLAEFLGTLLFVYIILATGNPIAIGIALGLVIMVTAPISGGHVNPAVSVTMAMLGKLPRSELLPYIASQMAGGIFALELFKNVRI
jgi:glycerol uptake facilitator-like aquaporin|tara:strand:+ start:2659 stop:2925 length:267 start_codon:yes stop_codon:yes gene_type:complete